MVHPGHPAGLLALLAGGSVTLLTTAGPPQATKIKATVRSSASGHAFIRSVFKTTPCSCDVEVRSLVLPPYRSEETLRA
jgi:hypothetical protein